MQIITVPLRPLQMIIVSMLVFGGMSKRLTIEDFRLLIFDLKQAASSDSRERADELLLRLI